MKKNSPRPIQNLEKKIESTIIEYIYSSSKNPDNELRGKLADILNIDPTKIEAKLAPYMRKVPGSKVKFQSEFYTAMSDFLGAIESQATDQSQEVALRSVKNLFKRKSDATEILVECYQKDRKFQKEIDKLIRQEDSILNRQDMAILLIEKSGLDITNELKESIQEKISLYSELHREKTNQIKNHFQQHPISHARADQLISGGGITLGTGVVACLLFAPELGLPMILTGAATLLVGAAMKAISYIRDVIHESRSIKEANQDLLRGLSKEIKIESDSKGSAQHQSKKQEITQDIELKDNRTRVQHSRSPSGRSGRGRGA